MTLKHWWPASLAINTRYLEHSPASEQQRHSREHLRNAKTSVCIAYGATSLTRCFPCHSGQATESGEGDWPPSKTPANESVGLGAPAHRRLPARQPKYKTWALWSQKIHQSERKNCAKSNESATTEAKGAAKCKSTPTISKSTF